MKFPMIHIPFLQITEVVQRLLRNQHKTPAQKAKAATQFIIDEVNTAFEPVHGGDPDHPEYIQPLPPGKLPHHRWTWRMKNRLMPVWKGFEAWFRGGRGW